MLLCIILCKHFEDTFENAQWGKSNKCNQCDYASSEQGDLRRHLKTHSGEKSNKCNQCDYCSYWAGDLMRHLETYMCGVRTVETTNVTLHPFIEVL